MTLLLGLILDWFYGDPSRIWKRVPHPIAIIGNGIEVLEKRFNTASLDDAEARGRGTILLVVLIAASLVTGLVFSSVFELLGSLGWVAEIIMVSVFLAQKSLKDHVVEVATALRKCGVECGRQAVSKIVGRDTGGLGVSGICRAAIESLAENFSDGVVAPALWYLMLGLPGLIAYKAINTADSMIGHNSERYQHFGRATALFDDMVNWPAARISAGLIAGASMVAGGIKHARQTISQTLQDATTHRSPNAGWPETAMAASLGISLGGPRKYGNTEIRAPLLNSAGRTEVSVRDIDRALAIFRDSCFLLWALILIVAVV